jgi:integrase/recombinase XerD
MAHRTPTIHEDAAAKGMNARFILFMGKRLADGTRPVLLQVTKAGRSERYGMGISCNEEQWDGYAMRLKPRAAGAKEANPILDQVSAKVKDILKRLEVFGALTLDAFREQYRKPKATSGVLAFITTEVADMERKGKAGNAATYRNTARVLRRFSNGREIPFTDLTASKLEAFDQHLRDAGCTGGGISVYMRTLRAVVGKAIKAGLMHRDQYPFETRLSSGYAIANLSSENNPRPITDADMDKVKRFPFDAHPHLAEAVRVFLFSYYSGGMNFADIARLKPSDVKKDGRIVYKRQKTKRKGRDAELSFKVSEPVAEILASFDGHGGPYLFPYLGPEHVTEKQRKTRIDKCLKRVNRELKEVAEVLGMEANLTTYVARHTFATTLNWKDVSVEIISQRMGHKSIATTRAYLKRLPNKVLDTVDELL